MTNETQREKELREALIKVNEIASGRMAGGWMDIRWIAQDALKK